MTSTKTLFAKFLQQNILAESGRLLYSLLYAFTSTGYRVSLFDNLPPDSLGSFGKLVLSMDGVTLTKNPPQNPEDCVYLYDKEDRTLRKYKWWRKLEIRTDLFSSYCFETPVIMPFPMFPKHTGRDLEDRLVQLRGSKRSIRIFFSGDTKNYVRNRIQYPKAKLPRLEVINTILERMGDDAVLVKESSKLSELQGSAYANKCVVVDTGNMWVDEREWLSSLAKADFFLSPPGIVMPMCHNIIEAMAVGAIPITNYPEWFQPNLTHMETCIVFDGKDDLIKKIRSALQMSADQIARMRKNVLDYYTTHLTHGVFIRKLEQRSETKSIVLLYTEANVARNWAKLNKYSILMRGTETPARSNLAKCLLRMLISWIPTPKPRTPNSSARSRSVRCRSRH